MWEHEPHVLSSALTVDHVCLSFLQTGTCMPHALYCIFQEHLFHFVSFHALCCKVVTFRLTDYVCAVHKSPNVSVYFRKQYSLFLKLYGFFTDPNIPVHVLGLQYAA